MVPRIESVSDGQRVVLRLSGRLQSEHVDQLKVQIEGRTQNVILDLDGVKLVDRDVVCFLEQCEASSVELRQCPLYLREWITRERASQRDSQPYREKRYSRGANAHHVRRRSLHSPVKVAPSGATAQLVFVRMNFFGRMSVSV
jgi:hypothetical protein